MDTAEAAPKDGSPTKAETKAEETKEEKTAEITATDMDLSTLRVRFVNYAMQNTVFTRN